MGIVAFIILGLLAGIIAEQILPGADPGGIVVTTLTGIAGTLVDGFLAAAIFGAQPLDQFFDVPTWMTAIAGAVLLLRVHRLFTGSRSRGHRLT